MVTLNQLIYHPCCRKCSKKAKIPWNCYKVAWSTRILLNVKWLKLTNIVVESDCKLRFTKKKIQKKIYKKQKQEKEKKNLKENHLCLQVIRNWFKPLFFYAIVSFLKTLGIYRCELLLFSSFIRGIKWKYHDFLFSSSYNVANCQWILNRHNNNNSNLRKFSLPTIFCYSFFLFFILMEKSLSRHAEESVVLIDWYS